MKSAAELGAGPYVDHVVGEAVRARLAGRIGWLSAAIHASIAWPSADVMVRYDGDEYFLRGLEHESGRRISPCITMPCDWRDSDAVRTTLEKLYRFCSVLGWFLDGYVDPVGHISGSHPSPYGIAWTPPSGVMMAGGRNGFDCNYLPVVADPATQRALAYWREGAKLDGVHAGYAFLSYYKVIESQFNKGKGKGDWINSTWPALTGKAGVRVAELRAEGIDVGDHIFASCRSAVAHASPGRVVVHPDSPADKQRIARDLVIIEALARLFIRSELGVPTASALYRELDRLESANGLLSPTDLMTLKRGGSVPRHRLGWNGQRISVNLWPHEANPLLQDLVAHVAGAYDGEVVLLVGPEDQSFTLTFHLSYVAGKASPDLSQVIADVRNPGKAIEVLKYYQQVLQNGIVELALSNGQKLQCELFMPVNVDIQGTLDMWEQQIAQLKGGGS